MVWLVLKPYPKRSLLAFSKNVKKLRIAAGLTQEQLAEKLDIDSRHFQKLEASTVTPSFGLILRLRRVLRTDWDQLFEGV